MNGNNAFALNDGGLCDDFSFMDRKLNWMIITTEVTEEDDVQNHFVAVKWHEGRKYWVIVNTAYGAVYYKAKPNVMKWLISTEIGRETLKRMLAVTFPNHTTE